MTHQKAKRTTDALGPEKRKKLTLSKETLKDLDSPDRRAVKGGLSSQPKKRGALPLNPQTAIC